eukprot:g19.t1
MEGDKSVCKVWRALPQIRTDRRKDRVEPSHEQLVRCVSKAEKLTQTTGLHTRVVGWYHSHPKITVQPSHVDLRTQAQHQSLDPGFIGLIISCFNGDQVIRCTAFQSTEDPPGSPEIDEASGIEIQEDMDAEMKEALRMSLHEYKASKSTSLTEQLHHKEIPIEVVRPRAGPEYSLMDIAQIHNILEDEEVGAYQKALESQKNVPKLIRLHQGTVFAQGLITIINGVLIPNINGLLAMKQQNELNSIQLDKQIEHYKTMLELRQSRSPSPIIDKHLQAIPSLTRSAMDALNDFIEYSTLDLSIYGELEHTPSHPIEPTKANQGQIMETPETTMESGRLWVRDKSPNVQRLPSQDGFRFDNAFIREQRMVQGDQAGPSNYQAMQISEIQTEGIVQSTLPSPRHASVSPADQFIPFTRFRTPTEAQSPPPSAFSKTPPPTEMTMFGIRPVNKGHENGAGYSAGIRKERPAKMEATTDHGQRLPASKNKGDGRVQAMKVPRMNEFDDIWKEARDDVYKR